MRYDRAVIIDVTNGLSLNVSLGGSLFVGRPVKLVITPLGGYEVAAEGSLQFVLFTPVVFFFFFSHKYRVL